VWWTTQRRSPDNFKGQHTTADSIPGREHLYLSVEQRISCRSLGEDSAGWPKRQRDLKKEDGLLVGEETDPLSRSVRKSRMPTVKTKGEEARLQLQKRF